METRKPKLIGGMIVKEVLWVDYYCLVAVDVNGVIRVGLRCGEVLTPSPELYWGFTARDYADLYTELTESGIPAWVASRWVNQGQGFDGV